MPVGYTEDIFDALDVQDELQTLYTSGTVFHAFLGEKLPDWKAAASLVRKIAQNYKLPYYTLSPTYSICKDHGYIAGEQYVRAMDISMVNNIPAQSVEVKRKYGAVLQDTIVQYRTGMKVNPRNIKNVKYMISDILY